MAVYSIRIKKGNFQLDLSTTDKDMVDNQFELWVKKASIYAKKAKAKECKEMVSSQIKAEEEVTNRNIETQIAKTKPVQPIESDFIPKDNSTVKQEDKKEKDLDIFYAPPSQETISERVSKGQSAGIFDSLLESSMNNPKTELTFKTSPSIKKDNAFMNYISTRKVERKIDYLLLTAYYFTQYEQRPRFTLKQLNAKLMQNIAVLIDHSVLQEAINRDYIECLPDLTGLVGSSEYRLTAYGEKVLLDE